MARELVTNIWCDVCLEQDEESWVEATELPPIILGSLKPRVLALCKEHQESLYEPFRELVVNVGVVADPGSPVTTRMPGTSPGSGVFYCPVPECPKHTRPLRHEQSMRNHCRKKHDASFAELRAQYASPDDVLFSEEGESQHPPTVRSAVCDFPQCEVAYEWPTYKLPAQALGVHKAKVHGIRGATKKPKK